LSSTSIHDAIGRARSFKHFHDCCRRSFDVASAGGDFDHAVSWQIRNRLAQRDLNSWLISLVKEPSDQGEPVVINRRSLCGRLFVRSKKMARRDRLMPA
jgi:hypothetical protein